MSWLLLLGQLDVPIRILHEVQESRTKDNGGLKQSLSALYQSYRGCSTHRTDEEDELRNGGDRPAVEKDICEHYACRSRDVQLTQ